MYTAPSPFNGEDAPFSPPSDGADMATNVPFVYEPKECEVDISLPNNDGAAFKSSAITPEVPKYGE